MSEQAAVCLDDQSARAVRGDIQATGDEHGQRRGLDPSGPENVVGSQHLDVVTDAELEPFVRDILQHGSGAWMHSQLAQLYFHPLR